MCIIENDKALRTKVRLLKVNELEQKRKGLVVINFTWDGKDDYEWESDDNSSNEDSLDNINYSSLYFKKENESTDEDIDDLAMNGDNNESLKSTKNIKKNIFEIESNQVKKEFVDIQQTDSKLNNERVKTLDVESVDENIEKTEENKKETLNRAMRGIKKIESRNFEGPLTIKWIGDNVLKSIRISNSEDMKILKCKECSFETHNWKKLKSHRVAHRPKSMCDFCGRGVRAENLSKHLLTHKDAMVQCSKCSKTYKNQESLRAHLLMHVGEESCCPICGKKFMFKGQYNRHMKLHRGKYIIFFKLSKVHFLLEKNDCLHNSDSQALSIIYYCIARLHG